MESEGAIRFVELWEAPITEAISLVDALGYILTERRSAVQREIDRAKRGQRGWIR